MVSAPEDDFASFLDFGDLSFPAFDVLSQGDADPHQQNGAGPMDTSMEGNAGLLAIDQEQLQQHIGQQSAAPSMNVFQGSTEPFPDIALQSGLFDQQQHQHYVPNNVVPPTPNSMDIHGGNAQYYRTPTDQQRVHMYDHFRRNQKEQVRVYFSKGTMRGILIKPGR